MSMKNNTLNLDKVSTLVFDFGNTLVEFGAKEVKLNSDQVVEYLTKNFGPCDREKFDALRKDQILRPYANNYIENDLKSVGIEIVEELYQYKLTDEESDAFDAYRVDKFLELISLPQGIDELLMSLKKNYRLLLISNFPSTECIVRGLDKIGIKDLFEVIVVSADINLVKPHEKIFERCCNLAKVSAEECLYIGDNWLADVQGSKRVGMQSILTKQYISYEGFTPYKGDFEPDAEINHISELLTLLMK